MDCSTCKDRKVEPVPYIVHESAMARQERTIKRLWILAIIVIVLLVATNAGWIYYESQWEVLETTITQENERGINSYIGNDGDIFYGETDYFDKEENP